MEPVGLKEAIEQALTPSRLDIVRAKRIILEQVSTGQSIHRVTVQELLQGSEAGPRGVNEPIEIPSSDTPLIEVVRDHPPVRARKLGLAATEAIAELASQGKLVPMDGNLKPVGDSTFSWITRRGSATRRASIRIAIPAPALAGSYRLPHNLLVKPPWFLDVDLFLTDLDDLELPDQLARVLHEAFQAFRHGLFLACAGLLGAVSEGVWYAIAERVAGDKGALRKALNEDRTAQVQKLLADEFRQGPGVPKTSPDELLAHASVLREIRNFGVHPRENPIEDLSGFLTEEACALLILNTHRYLQKLGTLATRLVDGPPDSPSVSTAS